MVRNTSLENPYHDLRAADWWRPEVLSADDNQPLSAAQLHSFTEDGFVVVEGLWPESLVQEAASEAKTLHPSDKIVAQFKKERSERDPRFLRRLMFSEMPWTVEWKAIREQGGHGADTKLNLMTVHPRALAAVAQLLNVGVLDLRLSQSHGMFSSRRWGYLLRKTFFPFLVDILFASLAVIAKHGTLAADGLTIEI